MFDRISRFECYDKQQHSGDHLFTHYYRFDLDIGDDNRYIVQLEKFKGEFYALKFYSKNHAASENKYKFLTNKYHASRVLGTVMHIANHVYQENKKASFGFIGEPIITKSFKEGISNTKRFRIYRTLSLTFFKGDGIFTHYQNIGTSAYVIINNHNPDSIKYSKDMIQLFVSLYPDFRCEGLREV